MSLRAALDRLGYRFSDERLLKTALTHRSYGQPHNERLEFLGDGVLDFVIAAALYARFPELPEGDLSRLRANLVRQDALHQLAVGLRLGDFLRLGEGELKSGGAARPSILADALEAVLGAIYLDGGFAAVKGVIEALYATLLADIAPDRAPQKDPKTRLQEWLQARKHPLPRYVVQETCGAAHQQFFAVTCEIGQPPVRTAGQGSSRRLAEQAAAAKALEELKA